MGTIDQMSLSTIRMSSCLQWRHTNHVLPNTQSVVWTMSNISHAIIMLSTVLSSCLRMRWCHKPMISPRRPGYSRTNINCAKRGLGMVFIRVTQSCWLLDGWNKGHKLWSMGRITMDTGMENCLSSRSVWNLIQLSNSTDQNTCSWRKGLFLHSRQLMVPVIKPW